MWDWEGPPPCSKCSVLNDRLLGEATKVNGLMRRIQEHQEEVGDPKERRIQKHRRGWWWWWLYWERAAQKHEQCTRKPFQKYVLTSLGVIRVEYLCENTGQTR